MCYFVRLAAPYMYVCAHTRTPIHTRALIMGGVAAQVMKQELVSLSTQKAEIEKLLADTESKLELL